MQKVKRRLRWNIEGNTMTWEVHFYFVQSKSLSGRRQQGSLIDGKNHSDIAELEIVKEMKCFHCLTIYNGKFRTVV